MPPVLIVEDEEQFSRLVASGPDALLALERVPADLVLPDWMLPGLDGLEACRRIRARSIVPIMRLTARAEEIDRVLGLEVGADDTRRIRAVSKAVAAIAAGDLGQRVPVNTHNEIGRLAEDFNRMTEHLERAIREARRTVEARAEQAEAKEHQIATALQEALARIALLSEEG